MKGKVYHRKNSNTPKKNRLRVSRKNAKSPFLQSAAQWGGWLVAGLFFLHSQGMPWFEVVKWAKLWLEIQKGLVK